ncbi:CBS domain-containing protein [Rhizobium sp. CFBP 8762]|uniref:CBS domain-containing protein n=1 Tax=Rhizobium sp. CFBP 8762 TaxID=2775279 RepID=UPI0017832DD2|nr:CBS domain-containing protein [Rhizobium sp. CFBP 8762]MBD8555699.1 CBS domain-containing protein [Rhizobium sp. CFBP 8762]
MQVRTILEEKGRQVITIVPSLTVQDAAKCLHDNHIGAVVILDAENAIAGILTERDIVSCIARQGPACLDQPVSNFMWTNVYCCSEDTSIDHVMQMMSTLRARHIPVEESARIVGIISIGDVVKSRIRAIEQEAEHIKAYIAG